MGEFENRLTILKNAGQIGEQSIELAANVIATLETEYEITLTEANGAMLITHIVMANERILTGNPVEPLPQVIKDQLTDDPNINQGTVITNSVVNLFGDKFDEVERDYIKMHICNLVGSLNADLSD